MSSDLFMFVIGMSMALLVSFMGMMLAYVNYNKRKKQTGSSDLDSAQGGSDD